MILKPAATGARIGAALIDIVLVSVLSYLIFIPVMKIAHLDKLEETLKTQAAQMQNAPLEIDPEAMQSMLTGVIILMVATLAILFLTHVYYVYFETSTGQTPGKRLMKLRVVNLDGGFITKKQAMMREMLRWYFDGLFLIPAFIAMRSGPRKQRVGDLMAKTMVIEVPADAPFMPWP